MQSLVASQDALREEDDFDGVELTILMPCLNERATIKTCIEKAQRCLDDLMIRGEIIVADNGSTDGSQFIASNMGVRVIAVLERGYGAALIAGIEAARGTYVIMGDADDSYDFEKLGPLLDSLRDGNHLVMGNRFKGGIAAGAMPPLHRYLGNPALSFLGRLLFTAKIGDFHCGLRGFSRAAIQALRLQSKGMEFASEMVVKSALTGLSIAEVPVKLAADGRGRPSHLRTWRDGWRHLRFLLIYSPRWLFIYPGAALVGLGLLGMTILAHGRTSLTPHISLDIHTLVASSFAVLIGMQLVLLGALARRWGMVEGFLPARRGLSRFLFGMTLETVLLGCSGCFVGGAIGLAWAVGSWIVRDFGSIEDPSILRVLVISLTAIAVAVQSAAAAFFGSILAIRHRT